jgi:filamentous hemagglutinin
MKLMWLYAMVSASTSAAASTVGSIGGSVNAGKSSINSNYASVTEQSGIRAGDGGFNVRVQGNTQLTGGQITSTQAAVDNQLNSFTTAGQTASEASNSGKLTITDLQNSARFNAKSSSATIGIGSQLGSSGAGIGSASGNASSTTITIDDALYQKALELAAPKLDSRP